MSLAAFLEASPRVIAVRLTRVRGSSPREAGTEMFVAVDGFFGTIGGGQLEYMAIDKARSMLKSGEIATEMDVPLGPEIGQCCGGRVEISLSLMSGDARTAAMAAETRRLEELPHVYVLGAGHVGRALSDLFQHLPVRCILIDNRAAELGMCGAGIEKRLSVMAEADIRTAPAGSAFIVLTHDHALDFLLTAEALARHDAAYVGLIGSATKRVKFERFCAAGASKADTHRLVCPIGAVGRGDKRPEVIAAFVVAEVMAALTEMVRSPEKTAE
ncbi:xanthine dehydrogenase accessory protein XdhC [Amaricoccus macauensis]|uniref:xanthine dehydrogenase accessory protein XdhC n=1 Tax=Amaricoccus macauensis TaxID=57001 RepID=UPI003C7BBDA4